jgi:uncharacterized protein (DUF1684 family)
MTTTEHTSRSAFADAWNDWHREREAYFRDPLGWVSLNGLYWLTDEFAEVADLPGRWRADADAVYVEGVAGTERLEPVEGAPGLLVEDGDRRIEVIRRTGSVALRVHDPKSPHLQDFHGIPAYPPSESWVISGRFTPYEQSRTLTTGAVVEGLEHHHQAVGVIDFEVAGHPLQLVAFNGRDGGLHVLFTDATGGVTTYAACRGLSVPAPTADGMVTLDFNRAANLPCAFTDYATCPVAPAENRLPIAVEAGEKNPR